MINASTINKEVTERIKDFAQLIDAGILPRERMESLPINLLGYVIAEQGYEVYLDGAEWIKPTVTPSFPRLLKVYVSVKETAPSTFGVTMSALFDEDTAKALFTTDSEKAILKTLLSESEPECTMSTLFVTTNDPEKARQEAEAIEAAAGMAIKEWIAGTTMQMKTHGPKPIKTPINLPLVITDDRKFIASMDYAYAVSEAIGTDGEVHARLTVRDLDDLFALPKQVNVSLKYIMRQLGHGTDVTEALMTSLLNASPLAKIKQEPEMPTLEVVDKLVAYGKLIRAELRLVVGAATYRILWNLDGEQGLFIDDRRVAAVEQGVPFAIALRRIVAIGIHHAMIHGFAGNEMIHWRGVRFDDVWACDIDVEEILSPKDYVLAKQPYQWVAHWRDKEATLTDMWTLSVGCQGLQSQTSFLQVADMANKLAKEVTPLLATLREPDEDDKWEVYGIEWKGTDIIGLVIGIGNIAYRMKVEDVCGVVTYVVTYEDIRRHGSEPLLVYHHHPLSMDTFMSVVLDIAVFNRVNLGHEVAMHLSNLWLDDIKPIYKDVLLKPINQAIAKYMEQQ